MSSVLVQESARIAPVPVGWAAMLSSDPSTQVTLVAGLLTCIYMLAQLFLIVRRARIEREKHKMAKREHNITIAKLKAERERAGE
jgi:UDP-N-acetylmuramyl pentapeptide phosphotransferase/UDP-N-acetylglucosamine-1-phosphate transferase